MSSRAIGAFLLAAVAGGLLAWPARAAENNAATTAAQKLVDDALRAEVAGDAARREALLAEALQLAPDYRPARWHSGQLHADGDWRTIEDVQKAAAADPRRIEYLMLREANGDSFDGQLALARWCRKNGLGEEARFHWRTVLSHEPNNDEALRALGVRWYAGRLMTYAEIDTAREWQREARRVAKKFEPQVAQWERLLSAGDILSRDKALAEIRALRDTDAIPAIEDVTLDMNLNTNGKFERAMQIGLALVEALDEISGQRATESLVRHAAISPISDVREAACEALQQRPLHDYVPLLLDGLAMPIESSFRMTTNRDGSVHYWHSLYHIGPAADWSVDLSQAAWQHTQPPHDPAEDGVLSSGEIALEGRAAQWTAAVAARFGNEFANQAARLEREVAEHNRRVSAVNDRIIAVLANTTGRELTADPREWWDWWDEYNHYYRPEERPVYQSYSSDVQHHYYPPPQMMSCFAAGTLVWTNTGQREIETLEIGDLVLAQDADTGELAYKPIIGRTVRPPSETVKLALDGDELHTTLGHPLWVAGVGWRMAKELGEGAILHGIHGPMRIDAIQPADEIEAYNLIVADFNTYFVGTSGILAHDNTPREPTTAKVPGLVAE